ncbi:aminopeptidase N [Rugosimonospora acidiphila]|uniref:Aminopeptidase N n=1 Tax=Rugosimonospora acidiphila TaxID=556531 RepID=A0ABP9RZM5_9ACTN
MSEWRNLTSVEAAERARLLDVSSYDITLDLTDGSGGPGAGTFRSTTRVSFGCSEPGTSTFIELAAARVRSARLGGVGLDTSAWSARAGLVLPRLAAENRLVIDADFAYSTSGQGLHRGVDPVDGEVYLYTQFEIADAQRVFACFDQPDLKAAYAWHVLVPAPWTVVSNAPVERVEPGRVPGTKTVHFGASVRMSTYVTALCAGPYHEVSEHHDGIRLGLFIRDSMRRHLDADELFLITRQGFDFFHRQFGPRYPLPKYDQVFVPEFNGAAMENFGCVTLGEEYFIFRSRVTDFEHEKRANHILHELAHMWFGNLVTMRWWEDLWLKEAFADWAAYWCSASNTRFTDAWTTFLSIRKNWGYRQDQLSSTHPVHSRMPDVDSVEANFDAITYAKGASVIKQLVAYLGTDAFLTGLRAYLSAHSEGNATFDDLLTALERASGTGLREFAAQWLETAQVNTLRPAVSVTADGRYESVAIEQEAPAEHPTLRAHRVAIGLYDVDGRRLRRRERVELVVTGRRTAVPGLVGVPAADLLLVNDDDLTYAKVRLDPRSLATVLDRLPGLESSLARALCWAACWDLTRDAELPAREFVRLVCTALPSETDINLITSALRQVQAAIDQSTLRQVQTVLDHYADPAWAPIGRRRIAEAALAALTVPPAGRPSEMPPAGRSSDMTAAGRPSEVTAAGPTARRDGGRRLAWARAFVCAARAPAELAVLRGWLAGDGVPDGLAVDTELRWAIVSALVAEGAAGTEEIDAELARDRTASGERAAATARALIPTPESKELTWRRLVGEDLPNWLRRALLCGFYHPSQLALTRPYVPAYFAAIGPFWNTHDNQAGQEFVVSGYPTIHVEQSVVDATDAWLADPGRPGPVRRLVGDGRDNQLRAMAARARDAAGR